MASPFCNISRAVSSFPQFRIKNCNMPPTFPIFLAFIAYFLLLSISLLLFTPMLFKRSTKQIAKKVIATIFLSFPCLVAVLILFGAILLVPGGIIFWLINTGYISKSAYSLILITGLCVFLILVIASSLYLWYFTSKIIYLKIDNKSVSEYIKTAKIASFILAHFAKYQIIKNS